MVQMSSRDVLGVSSETEWYDLLNREFASSDIVLLTGDFDITVDQGPLELGQATLMGNGHTITLLNLTNWTGLVSLQSPGAILDVNIDATTTTIAANSAALVTSDGSGFIRGCVATVNLTEEDSAAFAVAFGVQGDEISGCHAEILSCIASDCVGIVNGFTGSVVRFCTCVASSISEAHFNGIATFRGNPGYERFVTDCWTTMDNDAHASAGAIISIALAGVSNEDRSAVFMARCASNGNLIGSLVMAEHGVLFVTDCYTSAGSLIGLCMYVSGGLNLWNLYITSCLVMGGGPWIAEMQNTNMNPSEQISIVIEYSFTEPGSSFVGVYTGAGHEINEFGFDSLPSVWDDAVAFYTEYTWNTNTRMLRTFDNIDPGTGQSFTNESANSTRAEPFRAFMYTGVSNFPALNFGGFLSVDGAAVVAMDNEPLEQTGDLTAADLAVTLRITTVGWDLPAMDAITATSSDPDIVAIESTLLAWSERSLADDLAFPIIVSPVATDTVVTLTFTPSDILTRELNMSPLTYRVTVRGAVPCFAGWMSVRMARTQRLRPVRDLRAGHVVVDCNGTAHVVHKVVRASTRHLTVVAPHAIAPGVPTHELVLTPSHMIQHPQGAWITARQVGRNIVMPEALDVFHVCLRHWTVLPMAGARVETCAWLPQHQNDRNRARRCKASLSLPSTAASLSLL